MDIFCVASSPASACLAAPASPGGGVGTRLGSGAASAGMAASESLGVDGSVVGRVAGGVAPEESRDCPSNESRMSARTSLDTCGTPAAAGFHVAAGLAEEAGGGGGAPGDTPGRA